MQVGRNGKWQLAYDDAPRHLNGRETSLVEREREREKKNLSSYHLGKSPTAAVETKSNGAEEKGNFDGNGQTSSEMALFPSD